MSDEINSKGLLEKASEVIWEQTIQIFQIQVGIYCTIYPLLLDLEHPHCETCLDPL